MVPVFGGQIEVAKGGELHRPRAQFARNVDAAIKVGEEQVAAGIADAAAHIEVLRRIGNLEGATYRIPLIRPRILGDAHHAGSGLGAGRPHPNALEPGGTGRHRHHFLADQVGATRRQDADVVDDQTKRRGVADVDARAAVRNGTATIDCRLDRGAALVVGIDIDAAARGGDRGQSQEQLVEGRARSGHTIDGFGQAQFLELGVDLLEKRLVTRHHLGVARMALDPANDLGAIFEERIGNVGIHQLRQRQILGLDHIEVVGKRHRQAHALVACNRDHVAPASLEALGSVDRDARADALVPLA